MITQIIPKLPMRDAQATRTYYCDQLGFELLNDYGHYLLFRKDNMELHFFLFEELVPTENYGQVYIRTDQIEALYEGLIRKGVSIHPNGKLARKPWGQVEFSLLDPDANLLTFGQAI